MGVIDIFRGGRRAGWESPATGGVAVTAHDSTNDPAGAFRGLYVGGTGNIKVTMLDGTDVTFQSVPVGILPIVVLRVWSTGTTATNIIGLL
jgi:hypothetical protein